MRFELQWKIVVEMGPFLLLFQGHIDLKVSILTSWQTLQAVSVTASCDIKVVSIQLSNFSSINLMVIEKETFILKKSF